MIMCIKIIAFNFYYIITTFDIIISCNIQNLFSKMYYSLRYRDKQKKCLLKFLQF